MATRKYMTEDNRTDRAQYRLKTIPASNARQGRSMCEWYYMHLKQLPLWETMLINHDQTHPQAVAMVNNAGGNLHRRFKTHQHKPGVIAVWRIE